MDNFGNIKVATCSTVWVEVTSINFNLLTLIIAKLQG